MTTPINTALLKEVAEALRDLVYLSKEEFKGAGKPYGPAWERASRAHWDLTAVLRGLGVEVPAVPARGGETRQPNGGRP